MASPAQIEANRLNAALSSGPTSPEGKARSSRNHLKFGLFSTQNCVRPEETAEYTKLSKALWKDLNPVGPVEQMLAIEIVRAAWRLQRCAVAEAEDGANPATQVSVDRARASATTPCAASSATCASSNPIAGYAPKSCATVSTRLTSV